MLRYQPILAITGLLLVALGVVMILPALVDLSAGNPDWMVFALSGVVTALVGAVFAIAGREEEPLGLNLKQAFILTTVLWFVLPGFAALPFLGLDVDYADAFFETVSGMTTTGSTVLTGLDSLPPGIHLWRSLLQWIGGVGIVVMAIIMLPFLKVGGMQLFHAESSDRSEKVLAKSFDLAAWIGGIYVGLTLLCALAYAAGGMTFFDAICHAMTTLSTGGFSTHDASFGYFGDNPELLWTGSFFMLAGAMPFVAYIGALRGRPYEIVRDPQVLALVGLLLIVCTGLAVQLTLTGEFTFGQALRHSTFNVVSVVTTTGYASLDYTQLGTFSVGLFFVLTYVGGCTGSTAGGIKIYRLVILWEIIRRQIRLLAHPSRIDPLRYAGRRIPADVPPSVLAFLTLYVGTTVIITMILAALGLDFVTAISAAVTAVGNVGPGLGEIVGPAGNFSSLPDAAKIALTFAMVLGRLELFTVLVLFDPAFWRW
ncbi:trk system potassium uptake protein TrkH [Rhodopseudomonas julia]|uniref:Trk system potassium uptake protein n=1 Tax=Rhodopseudomonas julia TaxID=200617 RepID=A0ABU0C8K6_9BRAD|nr:TrkH family potassium uptake protein [Rhodopseudomonas julia]MDQ0326861.1 trk system potassium uptake protein TrkH [Rhodopseudomonas julia]